MSGKKKNAIIYTPEQLKPRTFWELNEETNVFEEKDPTTGAVVRVAGDLHFLARHAEFVETFVNGKKVLVQTGVNYANLNLDKHYEYSDALADVICQKISEGVALTEIPKITGMPKLGALRHWLREHREFEEKVRAAKRFRAEKMRDEAVAIGKESVGVHKDEIPGRKLATDLLKWAAAVDDPSVYGNKVQLEGEVTVEMKLETGIRRSGDVGAPIIVVDSNVKVIEPLTEEVLEGDYEVPVSDKTIEIKEGDDEPSEE